MNKLIAATLILIFSLPLEATECPKYVQSLPEGSIAPCTGYLFSPQAEKTARQADSDKEFYKGIAEDYKTISSKKDDLLEIQQKRLEVKDSQVAGLQEQLTTEKSALNKGLYIGVGILATILIGNNVHR